MRGFITAVGVVGGAVVGVGLLSALGEEFISISVGESGIVILSGSEGCGIIGDLWKYWGGRSFGCLGTSGVIGVAALEGWNCDNLEIGDMRAKKS